MAIGHYEMTPGQYEKLMGELVVQADINLERALKAEAENASLAAAHEAAADELVRVVQELREARHKLELENQANGDLFDVIAEIAAMFDIPRSAPYISRKTIIAVAQMKYQLESADSEIKRLNDELATALNLPF